MPTFTELAVNILVSAKALDDYTASKGLSPSSFQQYNLGGLPTDLENHRKALVDSTQTLKQLAVGPIGQFYEILFNFTNALALRYIYRNNIASYVPREGSISYANIARESGLDEVLIRRFVQHACHHNIFQERTPGQVSHTAASLLLKESQGMRDAVGFLLEDIAPGSTKVIEAHSKWPNSAEPNETGFNVEFSTNDSFYIELAKDPERSRRFGGGMRFMTQGDLYDLRHLIDNYDWAALDGAKSAGTIVDVGGSHGSVSTALARATQRLHFVVQDLPGTVEEGRAQLPKELQSRIEFMAHDFFQPQPVKGADVYLFRFIMHNWADKYAARILQALIPAFKDGSRVLIYEFLPSEVASTSWSQKQNRNLDMIQATGWNSLERTAPDWERLFTLADPRFEFQGTRTPSGSLISLISAVWRPERGLAPSNGISTSNGVKANLVNGTNGINGTNGVNGAHTPSSGVKPFYVPTVNIGPYLENPTSESSQRIVNDIREACLSTGFFQITGHGISKELQKSVFDGSAAFFKLPFEEKMALDAKAHVGMRGYDVLASQSYEEGVMPDLKEGFFIGTDLPANHPKVQARRFFMGPNVWPSASSIASKTFRQPVEAYYDAMMKLTLTVLEMIAKTLPYGPNIFDTFTAGTPAAPLRLLHYPPAQKTEKRQLGASAHTDFGAITLLLQDEHPGLEVLDQKTNNWMPIDPNSDAYVVNVGDMLSMWTAGEYKSSVHRVLNKNPTDRYSVVFFFDGNVDCVLRPLDGSEAKEELTCEEYMIRKLSHSYSEK